MFKAKRKLLIPLFCSLAFCLNAQKDTGVKSITIDFGKEYKISVEPSAASPDIFKIISTFLPLLVIIATLVSIGYQIRERRKDDRLKNHLDRLNKQISEFYGPLYSLYETGDRNFYNFLILHGPPVSFENPNFGIWSKNVFQPTNEGIEKIIINKADLILGRQIPDCFLQFCKWSALMKVYNQAQLQNDFDNVKWQPILKENPHPEVKMQSFLRASFEVLKEQQSILLSGKRKMLSGQENDDLSEASHQVLPEKISKLITEKTSKLLADEINTILSEEINRLLSENKNSILSNYLNALLPANKIELLCAEFNRLLWEKINKLFSEEIYKLVSEEKNMLLSEEKSIGFIENICELLSKHTALLLSKDIRKLFPEDLSIMLSEEKTKLLSENIHELLSENLKKQLSKEKSKLLLKKINDLLYDDMNKMSLKEFKKMPSEITKNSMLTSHRDYVNEETLIVEIDRRTKAYIKNSRRLNTWQNKIWAEAASNSGKKGNNVAFGIKKQNFFQQILLKVVEALIGRYTGTKNWNKK